jgi:nucleoid-associated protein YgaU
MASEIKLQKAKIYEVNDTGEKAGKGIECMFNPAEYTVSKSNQYQEKPKQKGEASAAEFSSVGSQSLKLSLMFDTYESGEDLTETMHKLWKFMKPKSGKIRSKTTSKDKPVQVVFEWGGFRFVAYITSMTQRFTLFTHEGVPVRAKVDVDFTQYTDLEDYPRWKQNPTSGGGPAEQIWKVIAGDRLDNIAAKVYEDSTQWRRIAEHNHLKDPLALRPGQVLRIPLD